MGAKRKEYPDRRKTVNYKEGEKSGRPAYFLNCCCLLQAAPHTLDGHKCTVNPSYFYEAKGGYSWHRPSARPHKRPFLLITLWCLAKTLVVMAIDIRGL